MTADGRPRPPWWKGTRGEWWVAGQGALMAALVLAPGAWRWTAPSRAAWTVLGGALFAVGIGLVARAMADLGPSLSAFPKPRRRAVLVQTGLYAQARHPIYGGLIIAATGWAVWHTSGLHLLLAGVLALYVHRKALYEELLLLERFPDYEAYRARTRYLIPWIF